MARVELTRWGVTVPLDGPLHEQRERVAEIAELGYTDVWSVEVDGHDAFTPLALTSMWAPSLRLGTAIVSAYSRSPACLAQSVGSLSQAAPGRVALGIGASSNVIVENWNGVPFDRPYQRVRDVVRFLRAALAGEKVNERYDTFAIQGFRLGIEVLEPIPILIAALREGMLRLAGREGDGAIINWLSANDVATVTRIVRDAAAAAGRPEPEICARVFVVPIDDPEAVRSMARRLLAGYLTVPVYAAFHEWLGRGDYVAAVRKRWDQGDRRGAVEAVPDALVDELIVHGTPERCKEHLERYEANGVTTFSLAFLPCGYDRQQAIRSLAPQQKS